MFGRQSNVNSEIVDDIVYRSMSVCPQSSAILPVVLSVDIDKLENIQNLPVYNGKEMRCKHCGSYFNTYATIYDHPSVWKCPICGIVNQLPLPPSNSFDTGFSLASTSIPYNNAAFEIVSQARHHKETKNLIYLALEKGISPSIVQIIADSINEEDNDTEFVFIHFGKFLEIYNNKRNCFHVICINEEEVFLPTVVSEMKMDAHTLKNLLINLPKSDKNYMNINKLSRLVNVMEKEDKDETPSRLVVYTRSKPLAPAISVKSATFLCDLGRSPDLFYGCEELIDKVGSHAVYVGDGENMRESVAAFSRMAFRTNIVSKQRICFHYHQRCTVQCINKNSRVISIDNLTVPGQSMFMIVQVEYSFIINNEKNVTRILTARIPLGLDIKIYKSITFKRPFRCLYCIASYFVDRIKEMMNDKRLFQVRSTILDIAYRYPLRHLFKNFIFSIFMSKVIGEEVSPLQRRGMLHALSTLQIPLQLLYFLPLEIKENEVIPFYPKTDPNSDMRICHDVIYVCSRVSDPVAAVREAIKLIDAESLYLPIKIVDKLPEAEDKTAEFRKWSQSWEINSFDIKKLQRAV